MQKLIVVDNPTNWDFNLPDTQIVSSQNYLTEKSFSKLKNVRVFNLANDYNYQSKGYYVSLIAEATICGAVK